MSRYIDADAFKKDVKRHLSVLAYAGSHAIKLGTLEQWFDNAPSIDIVRCKECKHRINDDDFQEKHICLLRRANGGKFCRDNDFCSYGEREGE